MKYHLTLGLTIIILVSGCNTETKQTTEKSISNQSTSIHSQKSSTSLSSREIQTSAKEINSNTIANTNQNTFTEKQNNKTAVKSINHQQKEAVELGHTQYSKENSTTTNSYHPQNTEQNQGISPCRVYNPITGGCED